MLIYISNRDCSRWRVQTVVVTGHCLLYVLGEVVPQVPPVGYLDRCGCAGAGAV
jgi:hypothetical protein